MIGAIVAGALVALAIVLATRYAIQKQTSTMIESLKTKELGEMKEQLKR